MEVRRLVAVMVCACGRIDFSAQPDGRPAVDGAAASDAPLASDVATVDGPIADALLLGPCTKLAISDDFNDGTRAGIWSLVQNNPVGVAEASGQLQVALSPVGGSHYGGYDTLATVDLRDHCMFVSFAGVPANEPMVEMTFSVRTTGATSVGFVYHQGVIDAYVNAGTFVSVGGTTYDPAVHKVLRLREDAGRTSWETSPDGAVFAVLASEPTPIDASMVTVALEAGTFGSTTSPGSASYDNFDVP